MFWRMSLYCGGDAERAFEDSVTPDAQSGHWLAAHLVRILLHDCLSYEVPERAIHLLRPKRELDGLVYNCNPARALSADCVSSAIREMIRIVLIWNYSLAATS
jgi:hypothetical protein